MGTTSRLLEPNEELLVKKTEMHTSQKWIINGRMTDAYRIQWQQCAIERILVTM